MSHKYFTINERIKLEVLLKENYKISEIAEILNRHRATIYREIKRINGEYSSENAQADANAKAANKGRNSKITSKLKNLIEDRLCKTWSSEQIIGRELKGILFFKTIYNWLYSNFLNVSLNVLRRKGRRAKTKETRGKFNLKNFYTKLAFKKFGKMSQLILQFRFHINSMFLVYLNLVLLFLLLLSFSVLKI